MNRNDGARGDARKARESARLEAGAGDVEALAEALWIADRDASASGTGFGATFAEDSCNYAYRSQARYTLASDWLARVIADAKAEAVESMAHLFRDMANETITRRTVIQLLSLRAESYRIEAAR